MDDAKLTAIRAAAASRGARRIERASAARLETLLKAATLRSRDRSDRNSRSVETVLRKGGRFGTLRKLDTESE
jgi:hypothetical protein